MSLNLLERPKGTTHARIKCDQGKAEVAIKDFDCFQGVSGLVTFLRETRKGYEELAQWILMVFGLSKKLLNNKFFKNMKYLLAAILLTTGCTQIKIQASRSC